MSCSAKVWALQWFFFSPRFLFCAMPPWWYCNCSVLDHRQTACSHGGTCRQKQWKHFPQFCGSWWLSYQARLQLHLAPHWWVLTVVKHTDHWNCFGGFFFKESIQIIHLLLHYIFCTFCIFVKAFLLLNQGNWTGTLRPYFLCEALKNVSVPEKGGQLYCHLQYWDNRCMFHHCKIQEKHSLP